MKKSANSVETLDEKKCSCGKDCKCGSECTCGCNCKKMKKSTYIIFYVIGLILFLCIGLGIGAFVLGDNKESNSNDTNNGQFESESSYGRIMKRIDELSYIEYVNKNINSVNDYTNQELLLFATNYVDHSDNKFSLDEVNEVVKSYFGRTVEGEDIYCLVEFVDGKEVAYFYDKDSKMFTYNDEHNGHGSVGTDDLYILNRVVDYHYDGSKYVVKVKKAFSEKPDTGPVRGAFYRTAEFDDDNVAFESEIIWDTDDNCYSFPEAEFMKVEDDKLVTYEYVFEYKDENYILNSYKFTK